MIETAQENSEETDNKTKRLLSGKLNSKRKYAISIRILKKLKLRKTLTQRSELRALTGPSLDKKRDTTSTEYGANTL